MKALNEEQFLALIKHYESISLDEIEAITANMPITGRGQYVQRQLTGFGSYRTCSLCKSVRLVHDNCRGCVYEIVNDIHALSPHISFCAYADSRATYYKIHRARKPHTLLAAYRNRAVHMRTIWEKYQQQLEKDGEDVQTSQ